MNIFFIVNVLLLLFIKKISTRFFQKFTINVIITQEIIKKQKSIGGSVGGKTNAPDTGGQSSNLKSNILFLAFFFLGGGEE